MNTILSHLVLFKWEHLLICVYKQSHPCIQISIFFFGLIFSLKNWITRYTNVWNSILNVVKCSNSYSIWQPARPISGNGAERTQVLVLWKNPQQWIFWRDCTKCCAHILRWTFYYLDHMWRYYCCCFVAVHMTKISTLDCRLIPYGFLLYIILVRIESWIQIVNDFQNRHFSPIQIDP